MSRCAREDRREFIARLRRIANDITRSYQQASFESLEDMSIRIDATLRRTLVAFPEEGGDGDDLLTLLQQIRVFLRSRMESISERRRFQVETGNLIGLNFDLKIITYILKNLRRPFWSKGQAITKYYW